MRPILLGMNNPQGNKPLWPDPPGCTGWRIWNMLNERLNVSKRQYLRAFDRRNLLDGRVWNARAARTLRSTVLESLRGRTTVVLGGQVAAALGLRLLSLQPSYWVRTNAAEADRIGVTANSVHVDHCFYLLPHPSGLNRWYNDRENREAAVDLLVELYEKEKSRVSV